MQTIHTEKGDIVVVRGFQSNLDASMVFETPDGKYIYRSQELVPRSELTRLGILPPIRETLTLDERMLEKEYKSAGGASRAMFQRKLSKEEYVIVPVKDSDDIESFVIRHKDNLDKAAFVARTGSEGSGSMAIEDARIALQEKEAAENGDSKVSKV